MINQQLPQEIKQEIIKRWYESNDSIESIAAALSLEFSQVLHAVNEARLNAARKKNLLVSDSTIPFEVAPNNTGAM